MEQQWKILSMVCVSWQILLAQASPTMMNHLTIVFHTVETGTSPIKLWHICCGIELLRGLSLRDFVWMRKCKYHAPWWERYAWSHTIKQLQSRPANSQSCTLLKILTPAGQMVNNCCVVGCTNYVTMVGFSNSSTKLIRNLLSLLTWEIFAGSSAFGSDTNPPPDSEIVSAYIGKFIMLLVLAFSSKYTLAAFQNLDFTCS